MNYLLQEYINALSLRTRENARKQYEDAVKKHQFMVFIRDHKKKKLRSYIFDLPFESSFNIFIPYSIVKRYRNNQNSIVMRQIDLD